MPTIKYIFQGLEKEADHLSAFEYICSLKNINKIIISVAYIRKSGIDLIEKLIKEYSDKIEFYIGIRNGVTSIQAVLRILRFGIKPHVVDTATPSIIFHPKVFLSSSDSNAIVLIGSANLTSGGLIHNIEAGTLIELDLSNKEEFEIVNQIENSIYQLRDKNPENIFQINSNRQAYDIFREGRLIDERVSSASKITGKRIKDKVDDISKISLESRKYPIKARKVRKKIKTYKISSAHQSRSEWLLLWESNPLTERDLNIPSGSTTNPTGSMLFKKGNMEGIDQRHFFREDIFKNLNWENDSQANLSHLQRVKTDFELIIKGVSYGVFNLQLTHDTRTNSATYKQRNGMTHIHWGETRIFIARRDLLNCIFKLYKPINIEDRYIIDIS